MQTLKVLCCTMGRVQDVLWKEEQSLQGWMSCNRRIVLQILHSLMGVIVRESQHEGRREPLQPIPMPLMKRDQLVTIYFEVWGEERRGLPNSGVQEILQQEDFRRSLRRRQRIDS